MSPARSKSSNSMSGMDDSSTKTDVIASTTKVVVLVSSAGGSSKISSDQRRCRDLFIAKGLMFEELDGCDPRNRDKRDFLFRLSRIREYPQIFIETEGNVFKYIGTWSDVQDMIDCCDIPAEILKQYPEIKTFNEVFAGVSKGSPTHHLSSIW